MDDTAVAPVWNARARSSFLIAQAMRPRGFVELSTLIIIALGLAVGILAAGHLHRDALIERQRETIAVVTERADLAGMRADTCAAAVIPAIDTLRKCRAVLEARDEACACWLAPTGGAQ